MQSLDLYIIHGFNIVAFMYLLRYFGQWFVKCCHLHLLIHWRVNNEQNFAGLFSTLSVYRQAGKLLC